MTALKARRVDHSLLVQLAVKLSLVGLSSCSLFAERTQLITVHSEPPGAEVVIGVEPVGTTPLQHRVRRGGPPLGDALVIVIRKHGYQPRFVKLTCHPSPVGVLDFVGGAFLLFPWLGLLSDGAWELSPGAIAVQLFPDRRPAADALE